MEELSQRHFCFTGVAEFSLQKRQNSTHTPPDRRTVLIFLMKKSVDSLVHEVL